MTVMFDYSPDQAKAWLQDHAVSIWGRLLAQDPTGSGNGEIDTWYAYYLYRGMQQTVINFVTNKSAT
jgi:hypothetical protein